MNAELVKYGSGLLSLGIVCYTIVSVSEKGNGANLETTYGKFSLGGLGKQIEEGNQKLSSEIHSFKADVDKRMDKLSAENTKLAGSLKKSNMKTSKELSYLRGLTTRTHIDVELMKEKWKVDISDSDREKFM